MRENPVVFSLIGLTFAQNSVFSYRSGRFKLHYHSKAKGETATEYDKFVTGNTVDYRSIVQSSEVVNKHFCGRSPFRIISLAPIGACSGNRPSSKRQRGSRNPKDDPGRRVGQRSWSPGRVKKELSLYDVFHRMLKQADIVK